MMMVVVMAGPPIIIVIAMGKGRRTANQTKQNGGGQKETQSRSFHGFLGFGIGAGFYIRRRARGSGLMDF